MEVALLAPCRTAPAVAMFGDLLRQALGPTHSISWQSLWSGLFRFEPRETATAVLVLSGIALGDLQARSFAQERT
jgi:hypothetical protein